MLFDLTDTEYFRAAQEDRCAPRMPVDLPAVIRQARKTPFNTIIRDISLAGFCCDAIVPTGGGARMFVTLPTLAPIEAQLVWNSGRQIGCAFVTLLNPAVLDWLLDQHHAGTLPRVGAKEPAARARPFRSAAG